jgi:hypothetical protein
LLALYPLMWLGRRWNRWSSRSANPTQRDQLELIRRELQVNSVINWVCSTLLSWEPFWIGRNWHLPLGTSILAIAARR